MENQLKPCPFCGNKPRKSNGNFGCMTLGCPAGRSENLKRYFSPEVWNRRASADCPQYGMDCDWARLLGVQHAAEALRSRMLYDAVRDLIATKCYHHRPDQCAGVCKYYQLCKMVHGG